MVNKAVKNKTKKKSQKGSTTVQIILIVDVTDHKYRITTTPCNSIKLPFITTLKIMK